MKGAVPGFLILITLLVATNVYAQQNAVLSFCPLSLSDQLKDANLSFTDAFVFNVDAHGKPAKIKRISGRWLDEGEVADCLSEWTFSGFEENARVIENFGWMHGVGWAPITVRSENFRMVVANNRGGSSSAADSNCSRWNAMVDPKAPEIVDGPSEQHSEDILLGIECLLKLEGRRELGVRYGQKAHVSQIVPKASVEINALYQISELFYGNDDFAQAVALAADPPKEVGEIEVEEFNSPEVVRLAFSSYRKWFDAVKMLGLDEARKRRLDPLAGSGVRWY